MPNPGSSKMTFASWLKIASGETVTACMVKFQKALKEAEVNITLEEFMYTLLKESRVVVSKMPHEVLRAHIHHRHHIKSKKRCKRHSEKRPRLRRSASPAASASAGPHSVTRVKVQPSPTEHMTRRSKRKRIEERMNELFGSVTPPPDPEPIQGHRSHLSHSTSNITMEKEVEKSGPITSKIVFVDSASDEDEDDVIFVESLDSTNNNLFDTKDGKEEKEAYVYEKPCPKSRKRNNVIILGNKRKRSRETENNAGEEVNASAHTPKWTDKTSGKTNMPLTDLNSANDHALTSEQKCNHISEKEICSKTDTERTGGVPTVSCELSVLIVKETKLDSNEKGELLANRSNNSESVHVDDSILEPKVHTIDDAIISNKLPDNLIEKTNECTKHDIKRVQIDIDTKDKPLLENNVAVYQINTTPTNNLTDIDKALGNMNCLTNKPIVTLDYSIKDIPKISVKPIESMLNQSNSDNSETLMNIKNSQSVIQRNVIPKLIPPTVEHPKEIKIPPAMPEIPPAFNTQLLTEAVVVNPCDTQKSSKGTTARPTPHHHNVVSHTGNEMQIKHLAEYIVMLMEERTKYKQSIAEAESYTNHDIKNEKLKTAGMLLKQCEIFILRKSSPYFHPQYMPYFQNMKYLEYLKRCAKDIATKIRTEPFNDSDYTEVLMAMCAENYKMYATPKSSEKAPTGDTDLPLPPTPHNQNLYHTNNANNNRAQNKAYNGKVTANIAALPYVPSLPGTEPLSSIRAWPAYPAPPPYEYSRKLPQSVPTYVGGTERGTSLMAHYEHQTPIQHQHITANWPSNVASSQMHPQTSIPLNQQSTELLRRLTTSAPSQQYKNNAQILNSSSNENSANRSRLPGELINKLSQLNQVPGASIHDSQHIQHPYPNTSVSSHQYERDAHIFTTNTSNSHSANINHHSDEQIKQVSQLNQVTGGSIIQSQRIWHPYPSTSVPSHQYERNAFTSNPNSASKRHLPGVLINQMCQLNQVPGAPIQGTQHIQHPYPSTGVSRQQCESNAQYLNTSLSNSNSNSFTQHYLIGDSYDNPNVYQQYQTPNATNNLQEVGTTTNSNMKITWDLINKPQNQSAVDNQNYCYQNRNKMYGTHQNVPQLVSVTAAKLSSDGAHSQTPPAPVLLDPVHTSHHIRSQSRDSGFMSPTDATTSPAVEALVSSGTSLMPQGQCKICKMKTILKCTGCYAVFYCSNSCQTYDWPQHSFQCTSVKE